MEILNDSYVTEEVGIYIIYAIDIRRDCCNQVIASLLHIVENEFKNCSYSIMVFSSSFIYLPY